MDFFDNFLIVKDEDGKGMLKEDIWSKVDIFMFECIENVIVEIYKRLVRLKGYGYEFCYFFLILKFIIFNR